MFDVVVVGAGPAGTACASALAREGLHVLLIDRARFPRDKICGCCINPACWPLFRLLGVADEVAATATLDLSGIRIVSEMGNTLYQPTPANLPGPFLALSRNILDEVLLNGAIRAGAEFLGSTQLLSFESGDQVRVSMSSGAGRATVDARYLVGADGRNSVVASRVHPERSSSSPRRVALQWYAPFQPSLRGDLVLASFRQGYFGVVNIDRTASNIAMVVDTDGCPTSVHQLPKLIDAHVRSTPSLTRFISDLSPASPISSAYPINPRRNTARSGRVFLAGDARCTVEPITGEGILFGISDGIRTAVAILKSDGRKAVDYPPYRSRFTANQVASRLLRHPGAMNVLVRGLSRVPGSFSLALRSVVR